VAFLVMLFRNVIVRSMQQRAGTAWQRHRLLGRAIRWQSAAKKLVLGLPNGVNKPVQTDRTTNG
jgi:hypothetical protein